MGADEIKIRGIFYRRIFESHAFLWPLCGQSSFPWLSLDILARSFHGGCRRGRLLSICETLQLRRGESRAGWFASVGGNFGWTIMVLCFGMEDAVFSAGKVYLHFSRLLSVHLCLLFPPFFLAGGVEWSRIRTNEISISTARCHADKSIPILVKDRARGHD